MTAKVQNAFTNSGTLGGLTQDLGKEILNSALGSASPLNNFGRYLTGSRAIIKVNGQLYGFAFGVTINVQTHAEELWTIDEYTPVELIPTRLMVSGTLSQFHVPGKGPTKQLVQANLLSFLMHRYITIEISDQTSGTTIFKTEKAMITNKQQVLNAGEISQIQLQWKAIGFVDELVPALPDGADGNPSGIGSVLDDIKNLFG